MHVTHQEEIRGKGVKELATGLVLIPILLAILPMTLILNGPFWLLAELFL